MMKKTLIAMAALAATSAFAQSSVSIVGFVDVGYRNTNGDTAANKKSELSVNGTGTTAIHFRGVEDLGGGLKALFQTEIDWNPTQSSTLNAGGNVSATQFYSGTPFNGEQFIGLSGDFGSIRMGTVNSAALETNAVAQPFGTALGGGFSSTVGRMGVNGYGINHFVGGPTAGNRIIRHEKTVRYNTPNLSGFSGSLEYAFGNANAPTGAAGSAADSNKYAALGLKYSNGPLNVSFATTRATADGTNVANGAPGQAFGATAASFFAQGPNKLLAGESITHNFLAANYTFGAATVYTGYTTSRNGAASAATGGSKENATSFNIAGKYAVSSQIALMANYVRIDDKNAINADARVVGLGANYSLSNRTYAYARYENYRKGATNTVGVVPGVATNNQNVYMLGLAHSF